MKNDLDYARDRVQRLITMGNPVSARTMQELVDEIVELRAEVEELKLKNENLKTYIWTGDDAE